MPLAKLSDLPDSLACKQIGLSFYFSVSSVSVTSGDFCRIFLACYDVFNQVKFKPVHGDVSKKKIICFLFLLLAMFLCRLNTNLVKAFVSLFLR